MESSGKDCAERLCCADMSSLFGEMTFVYQADISWRWLANATCLPQIKKHKTPPLIRSEFSLL